MSMRSITEDGFGVNLGCVDFSTVSVLRRFVQTYCSKNIRKDVFEAMDGDLIDGVPYEDDDVYALLDDMEESSPEIGAAGILADAIKNTWGIDLYCTYGESGDSYCLLSPCYPWEFRRMDAANSHLTEESMRSMFEYMVHAMTGKDPKDGCIDYHEVSRCV